MTQQFTREFISWLDQTLQSLPYQKSELSRIRADVLDLMGQTGSLSAAVGCRPGTQAHTLFLQGTVPIFFQGRQYNTPVNIWIPETYPLQPPVCFVTPTSGMVIKQGHKHVDPSGMCYLPYLHEWQRTSNLTELVGHMSSIFGQDPPLRSVPAPSAQIPAPPPPPPQPLPYASAATATAAAVPPLSRPASTATFPAATTGSSYPSPYYPGGGYSYAQTPAPYTPPGYPPTQQQGYSSHPALPPRPAEDPDVVAKRLFIQTLTPRVQRELEELKRTTAVDVERLSMTQRQLVTSEAKIREGVEALEAERSQLQRNVSILDTKSRELTEWLAVHEHSDDAADVDGTTEPKDPIARQLLRVSAADMALEDALRLLDSAVDRGTIEVPVFIKQVRMIAQQQFEKRVVHAKLVTMQQQQQQQQVPAWPYAQQ